MQVMLQDHADGTVVLSISGDVDIDTAPELHTAIEQALNRPCPRVVVDLAGVQFCDSTGLSALVIGHNRAVAKGGWIRLAAPSDWMCRLLGTVGLTRRLTVHRDVPDALVSV
jgi:anti-sigma B factor antagonist